VNPEASILAEPTTKERLLASGALLFAQKGYGSVSIRDICAHADSSVGMVHHCFGNKQGLLDAIVASFTSGVFAVPMVLLNKQASSPTDLASRIEMLFETTLDAFIEHRLVYSVIAREQMPLPGLDDYMERLEQFLDDAKQNGLVRQEADSTMVGGWMFDRISNQIQFAPFIENTTGSTVLNDDAYKAHWCKSNLDLFLHALLPRDASPSPSTYQARS
jgi:AcrR family transcriptional regulator